MLNVSLNSETPWSSGVALKIISALGGSSNTLVVGGAVRNWLLDENVNDIDLAGDVTFGAGREMRIVKPIYFPKMKFSYALTDANSKIVDKGEADLKDMGFMDRIHIGREEEFMYEKRMIKEWFDKEIKPKVTDSK